MYSGRLRRRQVGDVDDDGDGEVMMKGRRRGSSNHALDKGKCGSLSCDDDQHT